MTNGRTGLFLSFEGTEGCGKTTQMRLLVQRLRAAGHRVTESQEPGATAIGKQIRGVLLNPAHNEMASITELLLMFASRTQAAAEIILPALGRGEIVVSDRFTDSSLAYQGVARGMGVELVGHLHQLTLGSLLPHLTLCIQVDVATGLARAHRRNQVSRGDQSEARIDQQSLSFHLAVSAAYQQIAVAEPGRFRLVNGAADPGTVADAIWQQVLPLLDGCSMDEHSAR